IRFIFEDTSRDPTFGANHLLSYLAQDFIESAVSILLLARGGTVSVAKREIRFIIESSVKVCYVQQESYNSSIERKLMQFDKELSSSRISIKEDLALRMLPEELRDDFSQEVGRLYGRTSEYVHLTPEQIQERIAATDASRATEAENVVDFDALNDLLSRGLASSIVLLFHGVSAYVAGDWLVPPDGMMNDWYFAASRFIAGIDSNFDYKAERQTKLDEIRAARTARIRF
ncbi:MAG: hypothetical protein WA789_12325, partial [Candidatus Acidiferrum sp.]